MPPRRRTRILADPWLSLIGIGEDGLDGLSPASRLALEATDRVFGAPRHLALAGIGADRGEAWPVPFSTAPVLARRGRPTAVLASGDPFWFGAGGSLARDLAPSEWRAFPAASTFQLFAARLGWPVESCICLGLHAAPLAEVRLHLAQGARLIALLTAPSDIAELCRILRDDGFAGSELWLGARLGGPRERLARIDAAAPPEDAPRPFAVAIACRGTGGLPMAGGWPDAAFDHDGQISKAPVRALAVSALRPRPGARLWDLGAGAGSVSVEFARLGGHAIAVERDPDRAARICANAARFGLSRRIEVVCAPALDAIGTLAEPDAVFLGGGAEPALLDALWSRLRPGTEIVGHAVTLETEALFLAWQARVGGTLWKFDLAEALPLGSKKGWRPLRPVVQWGVVR